MSIASVTHAALALYRGGRTTEAAEQLAFASRLAVRAVLRPRLLGDGEMDLRAALVNLRRAQAEGHPPRAEGRKSAVDPLTVLLLVQALVQLLELLVELRKGAADVAPQTPDAAQPQESDRGRDDDDDPADRDAPRPDQGRP